MTRGLTLVELVITIALAAILGVPVGFILSEHLRGALSARDAAVAMSLARQEMERLDSLNDFFVISSQAAAPVPGFAAYTRAVAVTCLLGNCTNPGTGSQGVKQITIVVTKTGPGDTLATLVSYRTKHVFFGS
jgi:prepilin-type N-terminal cleavage/methylation domain-containing protein